MERKNPFENTHANGRSMEIVAQGRAGRWLCMLLASAVLSITSASKVTASTGLPKITGLSQICASPGTTITINGNSFNSIPANNSVFFGNVKATITAASASTITVIVPYGATSGFVKLYSAGSTTFSPYPFLSRFNNAQYQTGTLGFNGKIDFTTGASPYACALGDLDGDGYVDAAVVNYDANTVSIYRNMGITGAVSSSTFAAKVDLALPDHGMSVMIEDLDKDGKPDLVVGTTDNTHGGKICVFRNVTTSGSITSSSFSSPVTFFCASDVISLAANDMDGDGTVDVLAANSHNCSVSIFLNSGNYGVISAYTFSSRTDIPFSVAAGNMITGVDVADLDADGRPDIVVSRTTTSAAASALSVAKNNSSSLSLTIGTPFNITNLGGITINCVAIYDLNGDGKPEVIGGTSESNGLIIYPNTGSAGTLSASSFSSMLSFNTVTPVNSIAISDLNGDSYPDILCAMPATANVSIFKHTGATGSLSTSFFAAKTDITTGNYPYSVATADIDQDGKPDFITANVMDNSLSVVRNDLTLLAPPSITSFSPQSGYTGSSVVITGSNFSATPANNIVYFGATKATVTAAATTSLTVNVPVGATYSPISVTSSSSGFTGYSALSFLPAFNNSAYVKNMVNFAAKTDFSAGYMMAATAAGDIDGDGKSDLAMSYSGSYQISILRNAGVTTDVTTSSFASSVDISASGQTNDIAIADIDGDGKKDLLYITANNLWVCRNIGTPGSITTSSFATAVSYAITAGAKKIAVCDMDGDGRPDVLLAGSGAYVSVMRNLAAPGNINTSSLSGATNYPVQYTAVNIATGDIDGDGKPEIITINNSGSSYSMSVLHNAATGSFTAASFDAAVSFPTAPDPRSVVLCDLNNDGKSEILVGANDTAGFSVFVNTATSGSIDATSLATYTPTFTGSMKSLVCADFDGDGRPDVAGTLGTGFVAVLRNTTTTPVPAFAPKIVFASADGPISVTTADVDGDGKLDIVSSGVLYGSSTISVLRNTPTNQPPTITAFTPQVANPGATITITGTGFNTTAANNIVWFGMVKTTAVTATATSVTAVVPAGASFSQIGVTNTANGLTASTGGAFLPTYDNSGYMGKSVHFGLAKEFTSQNYNTAMAVGDIDGDGKNDEVIVSNSLTSISVFRNTATSGIINAATFAARVDIPTANYAYAVAIADFDGDGKNDIIIGGTSGIIVLRNIGTPGSITAASFATSVCTISINPSKMMVRDMDGDGKPDIVGLSGSNVIIYRNTSSPGAIAAALTQKVSLTASNWINDYVINDINNDGQPDIVTANNGTGALSEVSIFKNITFPGYLGNSSFEPPVTFSTPNGAAYLVVADFNNDGKQDVAVGNSSDYYIRLYQNGNTGSALSGSAFSSAGQLSTISTLGSMITADFDGDGRPDIAAGNIANSYIAVYRNRSVDNGTPSFAGGVQIGSGTNIIAADIDGDNKQDITYFTSYSTAMGVIRNQPILPLPVISSFTPRSGNTGTSVTITGQGFNSTAANNIVNFGAVQATVTAASATSLTVTVPAMATYEPISVTNTANGLAGKSTLPFLPTFDNSPYNPDSLDFEKFDLPLPLRSGNGAIGDIDGDGKTDLAILMPENKISLFRNIATAGTLNATSFATSVDFSVNQPLDIALGDINGDGKPELIILRYDSLAIYKNISTSGSITASSFAAPVTTINQSFSSRIRVADLDSDGKAEVIMSGNGVIVVKNWSTGSAIDAALLTQTGLGASASLATGIGDFNNDGKPDICVLYGSSIQILMNQTIPGYIYPAFPESSSSFATALSFPCPAQGDRLTIGDVDNDGKLDVMVSSIMGNKIFGFHNTTSGSTVSFERFDYNQPVPNGMSTVSLGDFNGDGNADIASTFTNSGDNGLEVFKNTTPAAFNSTTFIPAGLFGGMTNASQALVCDFDGDGKPDVLMTNAQATATISIYRNKIKKAAPPIAGIASICIGGTSTLTNDTTGGSWLSTNPAVATIDAATGIVTGLIAGTTVIDYTAATFTSSKTVTVNPFPTAFSVTGGGAYCIGGSGAAIGLSNSQSGVNYTVYNGASATGTVAGTDGALSLGLYTATGTYTVSGMYTATGCAANMTGSTTVTTNPLPAAIAGAAALCPGTALTLTDITAGGTWSSSNGTLATVGSTTGIVNGLAAGTPVITYTAPTGCITTVVLTVNPNPAAINGTAVACVGASATLSDTQAGGTWTTGNSAIATIHASSGIMTGIANGNTIITYTLPTTCFVTTTATVNPLPSAIGGNLNVCLGLTTNLYNTTAGGDWTTSNTAIASVTSSGVVTGNTLGATTITYTLPTGCATMVTITVNGFPAAITGYGTICSGNNATLSDVTSDGSWSSSNTAVASIDAATGIVTSGPVAGSVIITYTSDKGCSVTTPEINPVADITGSNGTCIGLTTTLASATASGTWSSSNTAVATVGSTGIVAAISGGNTTITYATAGCYRTQDMTMSTTPAPITGAGLVCEGNMLSLSDASTGGTWYCINAENVTLVSLPDGNATILGVVAGTAYVTYSLSATCKIMAGVTVNPLPATISGVLKACPGTTTTLTDVSAGGTWNSGNISVATIDPATGIATGVAAGTVVISYTLPTSCVRTAIITINPLPAAIGGTLTACVGTTAQLTDATPAGLSWTSSNTSVVTINATAGIMTGVSAGTALITYKVSSSCQITAEVTVYPIPAAIAGTLKVCNGLTTTVSTTSTGGAWSSNNAAIATVNSLGVVTGNAAGTTTITYTLGASCIKTAVVTVTPVPGAITGALTVCEGSTGNLINAGGGSWSSDNTSVASVLSITGVVTGVAPGTANITYSLGTGCLSTTVVTVSAIPAAISGNLSVCPGITATLSNTTPDGSWSSSNTSYATVGTASGILTGIATGTARITYTAATGCITTSIATVTAPPAGITGSTSFAVGATATLSNTATGGTWTSSTPTIATIGSSTGVVTGIATGTSTITYLLSSGCKTTTTVTVNALPVVISGTPKACIGSSTTLSGNTPGGAWSSSNTTVATVDAMGVVTGLTPGTSAISYTTAPGVYTTTVVTINTQPAPISGTLAICTGAMNTLYDATTGGNSWISSDPSVVNIGILSGIITGLSAGTAFITYTLNSGCSSSTVVTVNPLPATITGILKTCSGTATTLADTDPSGTWSSGTTGVAAVNSSTGIVTGIAAGTSKITYTLPTGCVAGAVVTVNVSPSPITGNPFACTGTTATLASTGGGTWASNNTAIATVSGAGVVTGGTPGNTTITFTATNTCTATTVVSVSAIPSASAGIAAICIGGTTTLSNALPGGTWTSGNPGIATVDPSTGIVNTLSSTGTVNITYSFSSPGCRSVKQLTLNPLPGAISGTLTVCAGSATTLSSSTGGAWSSTNTAVGTIGSISTVSARMAGIAAGVTTISYVLPTGCARAANVTVNPSPDAGTISSTNGFALRTVSAPTSTTFSTSGDAGGTWTSSAATKASVGAATGLVTAVAAGTANITYSVKSGGCTATTFHVITVTAGRDAGSNTTATQAPTEISIYPNPTKGTINISTADAGSFSIYAIDGKEIGTYPVAAGTTAISLPSGIAAGVYLCRYTGDNGNTATVRIVYEQ